MIDNKENEIKEIRKIVDIMNSKDITIRGFLKLVQQENKISEFDILNNLIIHENTISTLNKKLNKYGYKYDKERCKWLTEKEREFNKKFRFLDIEETIDNIAETRYFDSFKNGFYYPKKPEKKISIDKNIYDEFVEIGIENGCEFDSEFIELVLLEYLNKNKPVNRIQEFKKKIILEEFNNEEVAFIFKYADEGYDITSLYLYVADEGELSIDSYIKEQKRKQEIADMIIERRRLRESRAD